MFVGSGADRYTVGVVFLGVVGWIYVGGFYGLFSVAVGYGADRVTVLW